MNCTSRTFLPLASFVILGILPVFSQGPPGVPPQPNQLGSLKSVKIPQPTNLVKYVRDPKALVVLGKALYWDMQTGSDGRTACATCHFHAGADHRPQNQLSDPLAAFTANLKLSSADFPFHLLANINDNRSEVLRNATTRAGSAGVFRRRFSDAATGGSSDDGFDLADAPSFSSGGLNVRQVTPRNTPSAINAVYYFRNFWDGRASNIFTGMTPFGESDTRANALVSSNGKLTAEKVHIDNSSLASQAVGPMMSTVEMAYDGRTWPMVGKRMLALRPLAIQSVAADDGVLGPFANTPGRGLVDPFTYLSLVQSAFQPEYWNSQQLVDGSGADLGKTAPASSANQFTQSEFNFALFFGLAVQAYESTLIADDTPMDRFLEGSITALTSQEQAGLQLFRGRARCDTCHSGAETALGSYSDIARTGTVVGRNNPIDAGFFRTGVTPVSEDIGNGGKDDFGTPFSLAIARNASAAGSVNGTFKTPGIRNVEFTGPYFHNGGQATLEQVVDYYSRGGDAGGRGVGIRTLNLSDSDRAALAAFMRAASDDRVRFERAPFDHPELCVPIGGVEAAPGVLQAQSDDRRFTLSAMEKWAGVAAVGAKGNNVPLQTFDELLRGIGNDGSRAHTMTDACAIP